MTRDREPLSILIADDEPIIVDTLGDYLKDLGHHVDSASCGTDALYKLEREDFDLALLDVRMPGIDGLEVLEKINQSKPDLAVVIITGHGAMDTAIQALRLGAADFLPKPVKLPELDAALEKSLRLRQLRRDKRRLQDAIGAIQAAPDPIGRAGLIGQSPGLDRVREQVRLAISSQVDTVLISGETGTGKEVVAREIHYGAPGGDKRPFIAVSCPALPETLVESELFGHQKGAFTGASADKAGYFELAHGGTLFLDEIADLSAAAQAKMLRVLETRSLRRVGGAKEIGLELRVMAATNVPLKVLVEEKKFRKDLFFRLNLFTIEISPLRDRPEDIIPLAQYFLDALGKRRSECAPQLSEPAREFLLEYDFPGNVRELKNMLERAAILAGRNEIMPNHLNLMEFSERKPPAAPRRKLSEEDEKKELIEALEQAKWNRRKAAEALDMPYSTLLYKIQKLKIG